jgi:predicted enzyme related to lactoylglutathione lyase
MFKKLRTVVYHVSDIEAAKQWYIKALGMKPYFDEPFYVGFDINGCELGLDADIPGPTIGNHTISFWSVDDAEKVAEKLISLGGKSIQHRTNVGGPIFVAIVEDPFGNHIGMIEGA